MERLAAKNGDFVDGDPTDLNGNDIPDIDEEPERRKTEAELDSTSSGDLVQPSVLVCANVLGVSRLFTNIAGNHNLNLQGDQIACNDLKLLVSGQPSITCNGNGI